MAGMTKKMAGMTKRVKNDRVLSSRCVTGF